MADQHGTHSRCGHTSQPQGGLTGRKHRRRSRHSERMSMSGWDQRYDIEELEGALMQNPYRPNTRFHAVWEANEKRRRRKYYKSTLGLVLVIGFLLYAMVSAL